MYNIYTTTAGVVLPTKHVCLNIGRLPGTSTGHTPSTIYKKSYTSMSYVPHMWINVCVQ